MRILCFGDSNTYGYDPRNFLAGRYDPENRWPDLLAEHTGWEVINAGVNGRQIPRNPYALRILKEQAAVDIFLVMLGTNDLLQGASAKEVAAAMESFITSILPCCSRIMLVSPPPLIRGEWVLTDALIKESVLLAEEYQKFANKLGISFVDTSEWNIDMAFDGVHFTEAGHYAFANRLIEVIQ